MLAPCARKKTRHDECARCGAGSKPASSSTLRTDVVDTAVPRPLSSPTIPSVPPVRVLPERDEGSAHGASGRAAVARDSAACKSSGARSARGASEAASPPRTRRPPRQSGQRAAQHRQKRTIRWCWPRPWRLPTEDRQLMAEDENLQLLRATRPPQQQDQREQIRTTIYKHDQSKQPSLDRDDRAPNLASPARQESRGRVYEP